MEKIKMDSGVTLEIPDNAIDDMEFLELLISIDKGNPLAMPEAVEKLIGKEQKEKLYNAIRTEDDRVPVKDVRDSLLEILMKLGDEGKNS